MKSASLTHSVWGIAAASAFAGGWFLKPSTSTPASGAQPTGPRSSLNLAKSSAAQNAEKTAAEAGGATPAAIDAWVAKFKVGPNGTIPPDRMAVAVQDAIREGDPVKSMMLFTQLMQNMTAENASEAFKTVRANVAGFDMIRYLPMLTYSWGSLDGESAMASMKEMGGREGMMSSAGVLSGWAAKDPAKAKAWLEGNKDPENGWMNNILSRSLLTGLMRNDPNGAMDYVNAAPADQQGELIRTIAEDKVKMGRDAATDWVLSLNNPAQKAEAFSVTANQQIRQNLAEGTAWLTKFSKEPWAQNAIGDAAREFASKDPAGASKWIGTIDAAAQPVAYRDMVREWARNDATAASEFVNQLPAGESRDRSIGSLARSIGRENPEEAKTWAATITDPAIRKESVAEVLPRLGGDREQNRQWAAGYLSQEEITAAASRGDRWGGDRGGPPWGGGGRGGR